MKIPSIQAKNNQALANTPNDVAPHSYQQIYKPRVVASLLVIIILVVGLALGIHRQHSSRVTSSLYKFTYRKLTSTTLKGPGQGNGMVFKLPAQFSQAQPNNLDYVSYYFQNAQQPGNTNTIGAEVALSSTMPAGYKDALDRVFSAGNTQAAGYKNAMEPITQFINSTSSYMYFNYDGAKVNVSAGKPYQVYIGNLPNVAWIIPFKAANTGAKNQDQDVSSVQGEVILTTGKSDYYYLLLSTVDANWTPNQNIWSQVLGSLKIDQ